MNNKNEAKKSGATSQKSPKTGRTQKSYDDKLKLKVLREMACTGETLASLSKRHDVPITTISRWIGTFGITAPKQIREQVMSKNISDIERKLIEKERECEELKVRLREAQIECAIKKASLDYLSSKYHIDLKKKDRFRLVGEMKDKNISGRSIGVRNCCKYLCVSRKGYYNRVRAQAARLATEGYDESTKASAILYFCRRQRERLPRAGVAVLHKLSNEYFRDIFTVGRDWLSKLLDANNMLLRETKKKRPPRTTRGVVNHGFEDHVNTIPKYIAPDNCRLLVSDITYVKTSEGFVYLSLTMDAYSRIITGFDLRKTLSTEGPLNALKQSIHFFTKHGYPLKGLIFHSDRGCQYISKEMTELEAKYGIITSVTQTGDPLHNAMAKRLNGTLKNDFLYNFELLDFEQAKSAVKTSVMTYNTARPHRAIGMKTPMQMLLPDYPNPLLSKGKEAGEVLRLRRICKISVCSLVINGYICV